MPLKFILSGFSRKNLKRSVRRRSSTQSWDRTKGDRTNIHYSIKIRTRRYIWSKKRSELSDCFQYIRTVNKK